MKLYELQHKSGLDSLTLVSRPDPAPGPGQVLIEVKAWSLNYRDLMVAKGAYGAPPPLGRIPLSDGVGEVVGIGAGVTRAKVGDRVAGCFMQGWIGGDITPELWATAMGGAIDGMLAQYAVLTEQGVVQVPAHMTDEEAATLPCAGVTAWNALVRKAHIRAGDTVLLLGTGGVSLLALQMAKLHGARTIITSSSEEKLETAKRLGADETINYRANPAWEKVVLEITGGRGADIVVEVGGAGTFDKSLAAVRMGGSVCMIGVLTGVSASVSTAAILRRSINVYGIYVGSREMFDEMNRAFSLHRVRPYIGKRFAFDEARLAYDYLASAAHTGKVVLHAQW
ncbi:MAG: NAD(P)-dependent alcohol dehydrogenase [Betaproteobacteria bacterium]|nr:NAD(P)-dependent alcohol dehydrogenase [Betaproteobacteria bacterium]